MDFMRPGHVIPIGLLLLACRSPLARLGPMKEGPSLQLAPVGVEDHSRQLKRLKHVTASDSNTPEARRETMGDYAKWFGETFTAEAQTCGIQFAADAPYRLEVTLTDLGEVRTKYIVLGIVSGVAWGVGTGVVAHSASLAVGLGGYELLEESAFWIGGSSLFSSLSAPAVVEARLVPMGEDRPVWMETYYALSGRTWTQAFPERLRGNRGVQIRASLQKIVTKILGDLEAIPGFPAGMSKRIKGPEGIKEAQIRIAGELSPGLGGEGGS